MKMARVFMGAFNYQSGLHYNSIVILCCILITSNKLVFWNKLKILVCSFYGEKTLIGK